MTCHIVSGPGKRLRNRRCGSQELRVSPVRCWHPAGSLATLLWEYVGFIEFN